jgi:hypothetical protein
MSDLQQFKMLVTDEFVDVWVDLTGSIRPTSASSNGCSAASRRSPAEVSLCGSRRSSNRPQAGSESVRSPIQIEAVNAAFTPSEQELVGARAVLDALDGAGRSGLGAVALDGRMLDEALAVRARRVLARADDPAHR